MRLISPRIKNLRSEDGTAFLEYIEPSDDRDRPGRIYRFNCEIESKKFNIITIVDYNYYGSSQDKYRIETGLDLMDQQNEFIQTFILQNSEIEGATFTVNDFSFKSSEPMNDRIMIEIRDKFCRLYLIYASSLLYNSEEWITDPKAFYPDRLYFSPFNLRKFWAQFKMEELP
jgi:hypothetical protein